MKKLFITAAVFTMMLFGSVINVYAGAANGINDGITVFFDFGGSTIYGWYHVDASKEYSKESGYGFNTTAYNKNVSGTGSECQGNAVRIDKEHLDDVSFNVDVDPGLYEVCIYAGGIENMAVKLEGYPAITNLIYKNAYERVEIPVTDGQLNVSLAPSFGGNVIFDIAGITVKRVGDVSQRKKRVFVCSDSIAAEYTPENLGRPMTDRDRGGWGQMLKYYIPSDLYVHNLSTPGFASQDFIDSGTLDGLLNFMEPGDYILLSYGINDYYTKSAEEFKNSMGEILDAVNAHDGIPIVASEIVKLDDFNSDGYLIPSNVCFADTIKDIAYEHDAAYINIHDRSAWYFSSIGYSDSYNLFWNAWGMKNTVHPNREGAGHIARLIVEECINNNFHDFEGKVQSYGISPDIKLKCHKIGDILMLVNTAPTAKSYKITTKKFENGVEVKSFSQSINLPAYNVLSPDNEVYFETDLSNPSKEVYIEGNGIKLKII